MSERTIKIIKSLNDFFEEEPWFGDSIMKKLNSLNYKIVNKTVSGSTNSIAKLVKHMINWRVYVVEQLKGNSEYNIEMNSENDWTDINIESLSDWVNLLNELKLTQNQIISILESNNDAFLDTKIMRKKYTYEYLVAGTIQHDIYHFGQIGILSKQLEVN